jgi:hypothetical protein
LHVPIVKVLVLSKISFSWRLCCLHWFRDREWERLSSTSNETFGVLPQSSRFMLDVPFRNVSLITTSRFPKCHLYACLIRSLKTETILYTERDNDICLQW